MSNAVLQLREECANAPRQCGFCGKVIASKKLKKCSRCLIGQYCSQICQKDDWPTHKYPCKAEMESSVSVRDLLGSDTFDRDIKRWTSQCERVLLRLGGRVLGDHKQAETHVIQIAGSYMPDSPVKFRIDYEPRIVALPQLPNELREAVEEEMRACNDDATVSVTVVYTFALGEGDKAKGTLDYVSGEVQRNAFKDLLTYSAEDLISVLNNTEFWN